MPDSHVGSVYEQTYRHYLAQLANLSLEGKEALLGIAREDHAVLIPYFGRTVRLTDAGLADEDGRRPDFADCVVICRYLIMCPSFEPKQKVWVAYRDFPDAGPLTVFWADGVEGALAKSFSGRIDALDRACEALGAETAELGITCDLCRRFRPLPKVPLLLVFSDADEDFPAAASLLFEKRAATYLDAESQAILGHVLARRLAGAALPR